jgi:hypothetical protein
MDDSFVPGLRCRATRTITHQRGILNRAAEGTVRSTRENIGRQLITVDFDCGEKLVLFAHEIEPLDDSAREMHS